MPPFLDSGTEWASGGGGFPLPRVANIPKYSKTLGGETIDLMRSIGRPLDPWQEYAIVNGLGRREVPELGEKWATRDCGCWVPRQNGKGDIIMALELTWLFLLGVPLSVHSAHEYKTAQEGFLRIRGVIEENDDVFGQFIKRIWQANGEQGIELLGKGGKGIGPRLRFMARTNKAGRGFSAPNLILDEGQELTEDMMRAILFVLSAQPDPQIWYFGTPPSTDDAWIYSIKEAGETGDNTTFWLDWGIDTLDLNDRASLAILRDPATWRRTNPSIGVRRPNGTGVSMESAASELKTMGAGLGFAMERCGMWLPRKRTAGDQAIDPEVWATRAWLEERKVSSYGRITVALHVNTRRSHATVGFATQLPDGRWHVGILKHAQGTAWIKPYLKAVKEKYNPIAFTVDAKSETTVDEMAEFGIKLPEVAEEPVRGDLILPTASDVATAFGMLVDGANNGTLEHEDQAPMNAAITAPVRPLAGGGTLDHKRGIEVGPGLVAGLAMWAHRERDPLVKEKPYDPMDFIG